MQLIALSIKVKAEIALCKFSSLLASVGRSRILVQNIYMYVYFILNKLCNFVSANISTVSLVWQIAYTNTKYAFIVYRQ